MKGFWLIVNQMYNAELCCLVVHEDVQDNNNSGNFDCIWSHSAVAYSRFLMLSLFLMLPIHCRMSLQRLLQPILYLLYIHINVLYQYFTSFIISCNLLPAHSLQHMFCYFQNLLQVDDSQTKGQQLCYLGVPVGET